MRGILFRPIPTHVAALLCILLILSVVGVVSVAAVVSSIELDVEQRLLLQSLDLSVRESRRRIRRAEISIARSEGYLRCFEDVRKSGLLDLK